MRKLFSVRKMSSEHRQYMNNRFGYRIHSAFARIFFFLQGFLPSTFTSFARRPLYIRHHEHLVAENCFRSSPCDACKRIYSTNYDCRKYEFETIRTRKRQPVSRPSHGLTHTILRTTLRHRDMRCVKTPLEKQKN